MHIQVNHHRHTFVSNSWHHVNVAIVSFDTTIHSRTPTALNEMGYFIGLLCCRCLFLFSEFALNCFAELGSESAIVFMISAICGLLPAKQFCIPIWIFVTVLRFMLWPIWINYLNFMRNNFCMAVIAIENRPGRSVDQISSIFKTLCRYGWEHTVP